MMSWTSLLLGTLSSSLVAGRTDVESFMILRYFVTGAIQIKTTNRTLEIFKFRFKEDRPRCSFFSSLRMVGDPTY